MRRALPLLGLLLLATPGRSEVLVRVSGAQVDVTATAAPLADVLDRLARQTGMKIVYEGPAPRQLVTLALHARSPAETVLAVLEGQGLNFALVANPTGGGVATLILAGAPSASPSSSSSSSSASPGQPAGGSRRDGRFSPPPGASPDAMEPAEEEEEEPDPAADPSFLGQPAGMEADTGAPTADPTASQPPEAALPPGARGGPIMPQQFSVSPFAPQPQPYPPQAPGMPTMPGGPPPEEGSVPPSVPPP